MGRERWFHGGDEAAAFDWYRSARELDVPLDVARALYERAMQRVVDLQRAEALYLQWLREAAAARRHAEEPPTPGRVTRVLREVGHGKTWQPRELERLGPGKWTRALLEASDDAHLPGGGDVQRAVGALTGPAERGPMVEAPASPKSGVRRKQPRVGVLRDQGEAFRAAISGELMTIGHALALDLGAIEVIVDGRARSRLAAAGVRGLQEGHVVYLHPDLYRPATEEGRYLLAHELVHVAQRRLPAVRPDAALAAEAEATALGRAYARGDGLARPVVGVGTGEAHDDPAPEDDKLLAAPPEFSRTVGFSGAMYRPKTSGTWIAGVDKKLQGLSIVLKDLVGSAYTVKLLREMIAGQSGLDSIVAFGGVQGKATQAEALVEFHIGGPLLLSIATWLTSAPRNLKISLTKANLDALQGGIDANDSWEVIKPELPQWMTSEAYTVMMAAGQKTLLTQFGQAARAQRDAPSAANQAALETLRDQVAAYLAPPTDAMEAVRADVALVKEPAYRVLFDLPAIDPKLKAEVAPAAADRPTPNQPTVWFLFDAIQDAALANQARTSAPARKQLLARYATRLQLRSLPKDGDAVLSDAAPGKATRDPLPSTMTSYPALEEPFFDTPLGGDREFVTQISFPDVFEAFRGYVYKWELIHVPQNDVAKLADAADDPQSHDAPGTMSVLGGRLSRDVEYGKADIKRSLTSITNLLGPPGMGATSLVTANAMLRMVGTVIKTFIESLFKPRNEKTMPFSAEGLYVVRCVAWPQPDDRSVIDRAPSVSWLPVWVRPARDMSQLRVNADDKRKAGAIDRLTEIEAQLKDPALADDDRKALLAEKARIQQALGGKGDDALAMERDQLGDALKTAEGFQKEQIRKRLDEIDRILKMRADRLSGASTDGTLEGVTRIDAAFVGDDGRSIRPLFEVFQKPMSGTAFVYHAVDSTTQNSGHRDGDGDSREAAIADAITNVLESDQGYGRGYVTISIPRAPNAPAGAQDFKQTIRIEKSLGSLMEEAVDNLATVASIAAIAAAPFTGGASLALLVPIGVVGALPSAYRLIDRAEQGTLRFDMATAMDVVNILGAAVGAGQAAAGGKAALQGVKLGRGWMLLGLGTDGLSFMVAGAGVIDQIDELSKDPNMPPGLRHAMIAQIVGQQLIQVGMMVGAQLYMHGKAQAEALGGNKAPPEITHPPIEAPLKEKFAAAVGPKGKDIPVFRDTEGKQVAGTGVEVHYEIDGYGLPTDLRVIAGPGAGADEIMLHAKTAKLMLEYQGFVGYLRDLLDRIILAFRGETKPRPKSRAWEARLELEKLPKAVAQIYADLGADKIKPEVAESRLKDLRAQIAKYERAINEKGEGKGYIAAHDDVTKLAQTKGYPAPPKDHFYFEKSDGTYQLERAADSEEPARHVEQQDGAWVLRDGPAPPSADMTMIRKDLAARLGVPEDQVVLKGDGTADTPNVHPPAKDGEPYEIHYKPGTSEEALAAAVDKARDKATAAKIATGTARDWIAEVAMNMTPEERAKWQQMQGKRPPEKVMAEYGGDIEKARAQVKKAAAKEVGAKAAAQATAKASAARAAEIKQFTEDKGLMKDPRVKKILDALGDSKDPKKIATAAKDLRSLIITEILGSEIQAENKGAKVMSEVHVWIEQDEATIADYKAAHADEFKKSSPGLKEIDGKIYREMTDMDLVVASPGPDGGPATVLRREEIKTGGETADKAKTQLTDLTRDVREALASDKQVKLFKDGAEITPQIDVASIPGATAETRGPEGRGFDRSLGITLDDLNKLITDLLQHARAMEKDPHA